MITRFAAIVVVVLGWSAGALAWVDIETVPVWNAGNVGEWSGRNHGGFGPDAIVGGVDYAYRIGKYEVTAGQYTEFLNSVAQADPHGLYDSVMWTGGNACKIERNGVSGSFSYSVAADWANRPVNFVSWGDAARFANWTHNGQPTGAQTSSTTEDGAYNLAGTHPYYNPDGSINDILGLHAALLAVTRQPDAIWALPTEDEWYKAAYHKNDGVTGDYFDYPTSSDSMPSNVLSNPSPDPGNNANFDDSTIGSPYYRTEVGDFENSDSPYGTFDQGGNLWEWNEAVIGSDRGLRGGSFSDNYGLHAADRYSAPPGGKWGTGGFRVVNVRDCNDNGIADICDIDCGPGGGVCDVPGCGLGTDCNGNGVPDECEPGGDQDCNSNGVSDVCDIHAGTSQDCLPNATPDECESDCNGDGVTDECELAAGIASDCNDNATPDYCDIAAATSADCDSNGTPDECDLDCNENGTPDACEVPAPGGVCVDACKPDCNANGVPDECEGVRCSSLWDGFVKNTAPAPFQPGQLMESIDYIPYPDAGGGDGSVWSNNGTGTATTGSGYGCDSGDADDLVLNVDLLAGGEPETGFVDSEYFQEVDGTLLARWEQTYSLSFSMQLIRSSSPYYDYNPKTDWRFFLYDASTGEAVFQMELVSTISARTESGLVPGNIAVRNPEGSPTIYSDTGIVIQPLMWYCQSFKVVLDNVRDTVELFFENDLQATIQLSPGERRMDYFRIQPILNNNGHTAGNDSTLRIDKVELCLSGGSAVPPSVYDCNSNGVLDACDIDDGVATDCNGDGVADGCRVYGDADGDGSVSLADYAVFQGCFAAPGQVQTPACELYGFDFDCDGDVDLADFAGFQSQFSSP